LIKYKGIPYPVELKIKGTRTQKQNLERLRTYMDKCEAMEGWPVAFDRDSKKKWADKKTWDSKKIDGAIIHVLGC
jgi:hypothetical protein